MFFVFFFFTTKYMNFQADWGLFRVLTLSKRDTGKKKQRHAREKQQKKKRESEMRHNLRTVSSRYCRATATLALAGAAAPHSSRHTRQHS